MFEKRDIETILKINGLSISAKEEDIREILKGAKYSSNEVEAALMVLRGEVNPKEIPKDSFHKILRSDESLSPSEINSLLGITVNIDTLEVKREIENTSKLWQLFTSIVLALLLAFSILVLFMYLHRVGPFHVLANGG